MGTKMTVIFIVIFGLVLQPVLASEDSKPVKKINEHLKSLHSFAPPHKVYLHLDKSTYQAGETIWFKAYVFDGLSHLPETDTSNVYIELINSAGEPMEIRILMAEEGFAKGDIDLQSQLPDGNYIIRAYTDWMRNFDEDYYFTQYLDIKNPEYENMIPRFDVLKNRLFNWRLGRRERDHEIAFFPEGGDLLAGTNNRVAFKVVDGLGGGLDAEGEIIDEAGEIVSRFQTNFSGIGVFEIKPEKDRSYRASVSVEGGSHRNYDFPKVLTEGYTLRIDQEDGKINTRVTSTVQQGNPNYSEQLILIGHSRGVPHFGYNFDVSGSQVEKSIDKNLFPSGIAHFTVFTENYVPVAERLVFIDKGDHLTFSPRINTVKIDGQDYFDLQLMVKDGHGEPVAGSFSFSAVTGKKTPGSHNKDILSYILLSSDLKEMVIDPSVYLKADPDNDVSADHLLLTYGWRRFDWDEVIAGELPEIRVSPASGLAIGGRLLDPAKDEPLTRYPVKLMVRSGHDDLYKTETGRRGMFSFPGLVYEGIVEIELSSRRLPADYPPVFDLNIKSGREYDYEYSVYTGERRITSRGDDWERVRGVSSSPYSSSIDRHTAPQRYGTPDQTIYIDYDKTTQRSLYEVLRHRASGLTFTGGQITIRGPSSLMLSNEPRFMLDGVFVNANQFLNIYPRNIERIEIFKGPSASIFGTRGGTGVILAYSRRPGYQGFEDVMHLAIMGYHSPGEFYSDRLPVSDDLSLEEKPEKTVHWEPDMISGQDGELSVRFPVASGIDNLKLTIEGTGFEGGLGFAEFAIDVEN